MKAGSIDKGVVLFLKDAPCLVLGREFFAPGKGAAVVRCRIRNLLTGQVLQETLKTAAQVELAHIDDHDCQFLYVDKDQYVFMDSGTYEQFTLSAEALGDKRYYLHVGETYRVLFWQEKIIDITVPPKVTLKVQEAAEAVKGDTVGGATKRIVCDTGLELKAPLFIKGDDYIVVNTDTGEYVERVSK